MLVAKQTSLTNHICRSIRNGTHSTDIGEFLVDNVDVIVSILVDHFVEFRLNVICVIACKTKRRCVSHQLIVQQNALKK